jgi:hypothetical protein
MKSLPGGKMSKPGHKNVAQKTPKTPKAKDLNHKQGHSVSEGSSAGVHSAGSPSTPHSGGPMPGK